MKTLVLPAIELRQDGTRLLVTKIRAGDLDSFTRIDPFDSSKKWDADDQGYQRSEDTPRVKKIANWLKRETEAGNKLRMPTAILLSARGSDVSLALNGTITLKEGKKLPLVDGQHRKLGFLHAINEKGLTQFADYELPVVILLDSDKVGEMRQFSIVNGTQKSVRTDLVNMILTQLAEHEGEEAVKDADHWKVIVSKVTKRLNSDKAGPWFDRIVMPDSAAYSNEEQEANPEKRHRRIARATSFMTSLKPIEAYLSEHHFTENTLDERAEKLFEVIDAFWRALRELNAPCFENADDYVMMKTPGIFALHSLCRRSMIDMHWGRRDWTKDQFKEFLANAESLADSAYWSVGAEESQRGEAAKYGSMKGFSELADLLYEELHD